MVRDRSVTTRYTTLRIVPLPDFFVNLYDSQKKVNISLNKYLIWRILKIFFWPCGYTLSGDSKFSPFLRVLMRDNKASIFSNPSLAALIDYKWYKARSHFIHQFMIYVLFAISFNFIISVIYLDGNFIPSGSKELKYSMQILFYWAGERMLQH